jgi:hypothetical protein
VEWLSREFEGAGYDKDVSEVPEKGGSTAERLLLLTSCAAPFVALALGLFQLKGGWDDGAITAAFSRTFADSGVIALTPFSPTVEGFSSLSWFLLLTFCHPFAHSPDAYLVWMKVLSALCFLGAIPILYLLGRRFLVDRMLAAFSVWLIAFSITPLYEVFNGMEMNLALLSFAGLTYVLTSDSRSWRQFFAGWALTTLVLATRFESPYILLALLGGCVASRTSRQKGASRRVLLSVSLASCGSFAVMEVWRHCTFDAWMPNTVYAKLWRPYQPAHTLRAFLDSRVQATWEIVVVLFAPLAVALYLYLVNRNKTQGRGAIRVNPVVGWLATAAILFGIIFGKNFGHRGRMMECLLPFLIFLLVAWVSNYAGSRRQLGMAMGVIVVLHLGLWTGLAQRMGRRGDGVPVRRFESEGLAPDQMRQLLHRDLLTAMIPDVGGASLCCEKLRILDLALLTNPVLGRQGYRNFAAYFKQSDPDVVEAHEVWAEESGIYGSGLLDGYSLVEAQGARLFVRNDLYADLLAMKAGRVKPIAEVPTCWGTGPADREYSRQKGVCLLLTEK